MGKLVNFAGGGGGFRTGIGREALEDLCADYNAARAERGVRERYRINKSGPIWKLETYAPDHDPRAHGRQA